MKASVEKLEAARALIARPDGWCQRSYATGPTRKPHEFNGDCAVCSAGALAIAHSAKWFMDGEDCAEAKLIECIVGNDGIVQWNDVPGRTQTDVIAAFDRAIEFAKAAP